jgi:hypothetical protein
MHLLLIIALAWVALSVPVAFAIGRGIRVADQRHRAESQPKAPDFIPEDVLAAVAGARRDAA